MKFIGTGLAAFAGAAVNSWSIPLVGVSLTSIGLAGLGAYLSFGYGTPEKNRRKLYTMAFTNAFLAVIGVAILPKWLGWEWASQRLEGPLCAAFAFGARFIVQHVIDLVPEITRKLFRLREYSKVSQDKNDEQAS